MSDTQHEVSEALDHLAVEIMVAKSAADALIVANSLRVLASRCEKVAAELNV